MTALEIITAFETQVDDVTELSQVEELALLNRVYQRLCMDRPWVFLRTSTNAAILSDANGSYVAAPADFAYFPMQDDVWGTTMPYQVINFADRRNYVNRSNFVYFDAANNTIRFTGAPSGTTYDFDYIKVPPVLTLADVPLLPGQFHDMLVFAMATNDTIMQMSPKATSYAAENNAIYLDYLRELQYWDAQFVQMN